MAAKLKALRPEVDADVLEAAEAFLDRVRAGETTGFLLVEQKRNIISWSCTQLKNRFEVIGYLMHAAYRLDGD